MPIQKSLETYLMILVYRYHKHSTNIIRKYMNLLIPRVFINGPGDLGSTPGRVLPKTQKTVLDASLLNTQQYKVGIKGKVEQSRVRHSTLLHLGVVAIEKGAFGSPSTRGSPILLITTTVLLTGWFRNLITHGVWYAIKIKSNITPG